ncbi:MAG TPA: hypothetical protein VKM55_04005 [Candidatus Lokiarchaeia archaeon]|nr:hypothetical protein [Candidatus Lokiarchaeia archaeon]
MSPITTGFDIITTFQISFIITRFHISTVFHVSPITTGFDIITTFQDQAIVLEWFLFFH